MSENLEHLLEQVNKLNALDDPRNDNEHIVNYILGYYRNVLSSGNEKEIEIAREAILSIKDKFPVLEKWCNRVVSDGRNSLSLLNYYVGKILELDIESIKKNEGDFVVFAIQYYNKIKKEGNENDKVEANKAILSIKDKFPKLEKWCNLVINGDRFKERDNNSEKREEAQKLVNLIFYTIREFREKNSSQYYPDLCSEYMVQLEMYKDKIEELKGYFSKEEYEKLEKTILGEISTINGVFEYSEFIDEEFGGRSM